MRMCAGHCGYYKFFIIMHIFSSSFFTNSPELSPNFLNLNFSFSYAFRYNKLSEAFS